MKKGRLSAQIVRTAHFSISLMKAILPGRTTMPMTDGGGLIRCPN